MATALLEEPQGLAIPEEEVPIPEGLTPRWQVMHYHKAQYAAYNSKAQFIVLPCGRRSGKTELAKRKLVTSAATCTVSNGRFIAAAPTHSQAKKIYWNDLKLLTPDWMIINVSESELTITLINGARLQVCGMDKPQRVEGDPIDGIVLDEYADMKPEAWTRHVRPGLTTLGRPPGWAWLIGVPEGRNHYYETYLKALKTEGWEAYTWKSAEILPPEAIAAAKRDLDPLTYAQEYEADFVTFQGRIYYQYDINAHIQACTQNYNRWLNLVICFDFNVSPGVAVICQELEYEGEHGDVTHTYTAIIGEVYIPNNSTTPAVCKKILQDWGDHEGTVTVYGDATGGSRGTAKLNGSDWELIMEGLTKGYPADEIKPFKGNVIKEVDSSNPSERSRVNAVNSRLQATNGNISMLLDPSCDRIDKDLDGVRVLVGSAGEIDKKATPELTHISDALGYYIAKEFPVRSDKVRVASRVL